MALKYIIYYNKHIDYNKATVKMIGGKAVGLHELRRLRLNVPSWATITTNFFKRVCREDKRLTKILSKKMEKLKKAALIRKYITNIDISTDDEKMLIDVWETISGSGKSPVAVRSSAADEDSKILSFAGQMDSFLNIRTKRDFLLSLRSCWASLFGDRAVLYRIENGINPWSPQIAVIVQEMIESEASGVIFTANPLTGNRRQMLITSVFGLGEGIVSGSLNADTFIIDVEGNLVESTIVKKEKCVQFGKDGGTRYIDIAKEIQSTASLAKYQLQQLHKIALEIHNFQAMPMDIEFAVASGKIFVLQARPITNLKNYEEPQRDNYKVWDNSNIVESYSGVTTPLTFSFIKRAYYAAYWQFCETLGVDRKTIFKSRYIFENMLGLIQGRVYYNLINWYRLISLIPGFKYNKKFMEQMMGLQAVKDYLKTEEPKSKFKKYFVHLPKLMKIGLKMIFVHLTLQQRIDRFHKHFNTVFHQYSKLDFDDKTPAELLNISRVLEDEILWHWKAPILNDLEAMIFYGLLQKLTLKWHLDETGTLHNDLLSYEGGIRSTEVVTELFSIAKRIRENNTLKETFLGLSPEDALSKLRNDSAFASIKADFEKYLEDFGVRSIEEMKLESTPIKDDPRFCITMVQNYLRRGIEDSHMHQEKEQSIRVNAETTLRKKLHGSRIFLLIPKIWIYKWVLKNARNAIRNRENQRFARAEAYSLVRRIVRAVGRSFEKDGIIEKSDDIFYLDWNEIWSFVEGTATSTRLKELIKVRRREFKEYYLSTPDDHIETYGNVYTNNIFEEKNHISNEDNILKGLGCCAGVVEREVRVVLKPDLNTKLMGEIMVAKQTDPGWVVLFPSVSGLIVEKGSMLSHSAIVAREMGIPAVVGVREATKLLRTGDKVRLNGATGTIEILQRVGPRGR